MKTLRRYLKVQVILLASVLFIIFYLFSNYIFHEVSARENRHISEALSKQVFNSMYQVMRKGWSREDLYDFLQSVEESFEGGSYKVEVYRSEVVEKDFGAITQPPMSSGLKAVLASKTAQHFTHDNVTSTLTPIIAKNECTQCHVHAYEGDVMGVINIEYNSDEVSAYRQMQVALLFLLLFPLTLIISHFMIGRVFGKIQHFLETFKAQLGNVNSVKELKALDMKRIQSGFYEFDIITHELHELTEKLRSIAVDKEILEFEIKLLDKFIITSEVVRDWKDHIKSLLIEINTVLPVYSLITIFESKDGYCDVEIFWSGKPSEQCREKMEEVVGKMLERHPVIEFDHKRIVHNICDDRTCVTDLSCQTIDHESKSMLLESPKIGGIVGLSIQSKLSNDNIFSIVIDSILTTLMNLVGSVKAINKYTETLEYYATRDPLTGLFNQRVFRELLDYEIKRAWRHDHEFGVLVIDCDNFKPINDTYGHSFGDNFLQTIAQVLLEAKRDEDILARYGGDEFAMIVPETTFNGVMRAAQRIHERINAFDLTTPEGKKVYVTLSIGCAIFPDHAKNAKDLFNIADKMMYQAKDEGKNAIRTPQGHEILQFEEQNRDLSLLVLDAIKHKLIISHFQAIMSLRDNSINIHELLMRLDVKSDLMSAGEFIEKAEEMGVVHQMDYINIEKAFGIMQHSGYKGTLFVNLSPKALVVNEFIAKINELIHKFELDKSQIVFEITERETVKSFTLLEKFVRNLKLEGYRFAIDDFGSGFSSFHYIKKFPIDFIKIDGEFILNITRDEKDLAFVRSIVSLAKELNVKTIAEFVEDEATLYYLKDIGVDYAQGYHIGRPQGSFSQS